jgi:hypothetical protein
VFSLEALPMPSVTQGNGDRHYAFDDFEYRKLPHTTAVEFHAPDFGGNFRAFLALFTPAFTRGIPPRTACSVTAYDAAAFPMSRSFLFGCWTLIDLEDIGPELTYPFLGVSPGQTHEHGWLGLDCRVDDDDDGDFDASGGVQGAIVQLAPAGTVLRRNDQGPVLPNAASWSRLLQQSVTTGDAVTLHSLGSQ